MVIVASSGIRRTRVTQERELAGMFNTSIKCLQIATKKAVGEEETKIEHKPQSKLLFLPLPVISRRGDFREGQPLLEWESTSSSASSPLLLAANGVCLGQVSFF
uniref:Uncharacterized protein n=1 Tax=Ditylenchus dipsaci TaxID=166011 RepID=A0A915EEM9_9BILA